MYKIKNHRYELRAHWVRIIFVNRGTFWPLPAVTSVGVNFVSSGDEVGAEKFYIFLQKGGSFFEQKRAVGK